MCEVTIGNDCPGSVSPRVVDEKEMEEMIEEGVSRAREVATRPTKREVDEHNLDHGSFRAWCAHCVKGRAEAYAHRKDAEEKGVPVISLDYMYMRGEQERNEEKGMPILVIKDGRTKFITAKVVPQKGVNDYAVASCKRAVEQMGYKRVILKSDNEASILALKEAVRRETDVEIVTEESPVGDHQANGAIENAVKQVQGQFRVLKDALESHYGKRFVEDDIVIPWLIMHAASVINRTRKDQEGFTAYRRWKGRNFSRPVAEFGECVLFEGEQRGNQQTGFKVGGVGDP